MPAVPPVTVRSLRAKPVTDSLKLSSTGIGDVFVGSLAPDVSVAVGLTPSVSVMLTMASFDVAFPLFRTVPRLREWWIKSGIYKRYGELKYLETQMKAETDRQKFAEHLRELDGIEDRVNHMKVPLEYSEHLYGLREHIEFVRSKLTRS